MSEATIWNALKRKTSLSDEAIAGIMGNLCAESNCEPCRVQGDFTLDRHTSKEYARKVDSGEMTVHSFAHDSRGFGLAQWTFFSRKENLANYCKSVGVSIGDEEAQIDFMLAEMQNEFLPMWRSLLTCNDIRTAAKLVCEQYERPYYNNIDARAEFGKAVYEKYHENTEIPPVENDWLLDWIEYLEEEKARIQAKIDELRGRL